MYLFCIPIDFIGILNGFGHISGQICFTFFGEKKSYEFETNVIQKNIREREAFAKAIGIAKLSEHFEKEQQLMDVTATENDNDEDSIEI